MAKKSKATSEERLIAPEQLTPRSQELWLNLIERGRVSSWERMELLTVALELRDRMDQIQTKLDEEGLTITTLGSGNTRRNPLLPELRNLAGQFSRIWYQLRLDQDPPMERCWD